MKFFKDPKNWRNELAVIGLSVGTVLFLLSFLVLGDPTIWRLVACVPLLLPLLFGSLLKMRVPSLADIGEFRMDYLLVAYKIDDSGVRQARTNRILSSRGWRARAATTPLNCQRPKWKCIQVLFHRLLSARTGKVENKAYRRPTHD